MEMWLWFVLFLCQWQNKENRAELCVSLTWGWTHSWTAGGAARICSDQREKWVYHDIFLLKPSHHIWSMIRTVRLTFNHSSERELDSLLACSFLCSQMHTHEACKTELSTLLYLLHSLPLNRRIFTHNYDKIWISTVILVNTVSDVWSSWGRDQCYYIGSVRQVLKWQQPINTCCCRNTHPDKDRSLFHLYSEHYAVLFYI